MKTKLFALAAALSLLSFGANAATISAAGHYTSSADVMNAPVATVDLESVDLQIIKSGTKTITGSAAQGFQSLSLNKSGIVQGTYDDLLSFYDYTKPVGISSTDNYLAVFSTMLAGDGKSSFTLLTDPTATSLSFIWGSIDLVNELTVTNKDGNNYTITGSDMLLSLGYTKKQLSAMDGKVDAVIKITDIAGIASLFLTTDDRRTFEVAKISAVPLPGALALFGTTLGGLILRRKESLLSV